MNFLYLLTYWLLKIACSLRYRVHVRGLDEVLKQLPKDKGVLILPNHTAEMDPILLILLLWPHSRLRARPVVVEDVYYLPFTHFVMKAMQALPCPNMEQIVNRWKIKRMRKVQDEIARSLKEEKQTFLIYPSGKLKHSAKEILGGASFVPTILSEAPDTTVVLIRTEGLWGSTFSRALTGTGPPIATTFAKCAKILFKNLLFFAPKRNVTITLELASPNFYQLKERQEINRFLEAWYNASWPNQEEPLVLVPYYFWSRHLPEVKREHQETVHEDYHVLPEDKQKEVIAKVAALAGVPPDQIRPDQELIHDLSLDSLDLAQLAVFIDERFHIDGRAPSDFVKVSDLFSFKEAQAALPIELFHLPEEPKRPRPGTPQGATLQEAFLRSCERMDGFVACADGLGAGVVSYSKFKTGVLVLSEEIRKLPGDNIGILLPASVGAYLLILSVLFAGKTPVMLNWTAGIKSLDHAAEVTKIQTVLSSLKFLTRIRDLELGVVEDRILLLDDVRYKLTLAKKLKGKLRSFFSVKSLLKRLGPVDPDSTAVLLFTSGTETLPKGVPLSHRNLLSNQTAALEAFSFENNDLLYAVLPPFHSFGFSVTGLLPILSGLKVIFAPDPNDSHSIARDIAMYHATFFCCAPSFIRNLFQVADPLQLKSLKLVVAGAEKAPEALFEYAKKLDGVLRMIEGYGITECGPIVTICRLDKPRIGVGLPINGIELCIVDPETSQKLPQGTQGEVCIHGPNVFKGYLGYSRDPFLTLEGKKWYRSGDLGILQPDGSLVLSGRLKRFVKIGAEMVSLGGLEEELLEIIKEKKMEQLPSGITELKGPPIALCAQEKPGEKTLLILFSVYDLDKEALNVALKHRGYSNLVRLNEVRSLREIPLTGTGKTHYRSLEQSLI